MISVETSIFFDAASTLQHKLTPLAISRSFSCEARLQPFSAGILQVSSAGLGRSLIVEVSSGRIPSEFLPFFTAP